MKHHVKKKLLPLFFVLIIINGFQVHTSSMPCSFPKDAQDESIVQTVEFLYSMQHSNGLIDGPSTSAWAAMALSQVDRNDSRFQQLTQGLINHTGQLNEVKATDWQRHALALVACGCDPTTINSLNMTEKLMGFYDGVQMGDPVNVYDDIFGILALISLGIPSDDPVISQLDNTIKAKQQQDGSWGDVDTTAMAIMALLGAGESTQSAYISNALVYLESKQDFSGGFQSWGAVNIATTSWAASALMACGETLTSERWTQQGNTSIDYILSLHQSDGSFNYTSSQQLNPAWMSSYALVSLLGESYPVAKITISNQSSSDGQDQDNHMDDPQDNQQPSDDSYETDCDDDLDQMIYIIHPHQSGCYHSNRKTMVFTDVLLILGPIDIKVCTKYPVDEVRFSLNNHCLLRDTTPPYQIRLNHPCLVNQINLSIEAIIYNASYNISHLDLFFNKIHQEFLILTKVHDPSAYTSFYQLLQEFTEQYYSQRTKTYVNMIYSNLRLKIFEGDRI